MVEQQGDGDGEQRWRQSQIEKQLENKERGREWQGEYKQMDKQGGER